MVKSALVILIGLLHSVNSTGQEKIKVEDVAKHIGDSVTICAKVVDGYYATRVENTPTFLNVGAKYPNQVLTIVIWDEVRKSLSLNQRKCTRTFVLPDGFPSSRESSKL